MITIKPRPPVVLPTPSENREIMFRDHDDKIKIKNHLGEVREATAEEIADVERALKLKILKPHVGP